MWFTTKEDTTNWLEVGILMGCLVSPILFVLAMQLLLKVTENNAEIIELGGMFQMLPVKAFMDNTTILLSKESTTCKIQMLYSHIHVHAASQRHHNYDAVTKTHAGIKTQEGRHRKTSLQIYFPHFICKGSKGLFKGCM